MDTIWKLQDAKSHFSQVVENAMQKGPQYVSRRGVKAVVVLSIKEYEELVSNKPSLKDFLLSCPKMGEEFEWERQTDYPRKVVL